MKMCTLCPRNCAVDRAGGERGICGQTEQLKVARAALHYWEEPCISGGKRLRRGIFLRLCPALCVLPEPQHRKRDGRKGDYQGASGRNIPGTAGKRGE